jgi:SAM-dependent methyltransferase
MTGKKTGSDVPPTDRLGAAVRDHYGVEDLDERVVSAFRAAGKDVTDLDPADTASFAEFHIRGRDATRDLAALAGVEAGDRVIDVGCGVGGAARALAAEHGAEVTGVDIVEEYCRTAHRFSERLGLADRVRFEAANALALPFQDGAFDVAWFQHTLMNVPRKDAALDEAARVLGQGGRLALYEICAGSGGDPQFPVPWAGDAELNFLVPPDDLREAVAAAGFEERAWRDVSATSLEWFRGVFETMESMPADAQPLGLNLLMGEETRRKAQNVIRSLEQDRIVVITSVFDRWE